MRFILMDKILELEPAKRILASKFVAVDEDYFPDHFPGYPVVPGVLLVEMIAQAAAKCVLAALDETLWPVFLQIRQANFRKSVRPGSSLLIEVIVETFNPNTSAAKGKVTLDGQIMAETSILLGFVSRSLIQPGYEDQLLKDYYDRQGKKNESI